MLIHMLSTIYLKAIKTPEMNSNDQKPANFSMHGIWQGKSFIPKRGWYIYPVSWWFFYVHSNLNSLTPLKDEKRIQAADKRAWQRRTEKYLKFMLQGNCISWELVLSSHIFHKNHVTATLEEQPIWHLMMTFFSQLQTRIFEPKIHQVVPNSGYPIHSSYQKVMIWCIQG